MELGQIDSTAWILVGLLAMLVIIGFIIFAFVGNQTNSRVLEASALRVRTDSDLGDLVEAYFRAYSGLEFTVRDRLKGQIPDERRQNIFEEAVIFLQQKRGVWVAPIAMKIRYGWESTSFFYDYHYHGGLFSTQLQPGELVGLLFAERSVFIYKAGAASYLAEFELSTIGYLEPRGKEDAKIFGVRGRVRPNQELLRLQLAGTHHEAEKFTASLRETLEVMKTFSSGNDASFHGSGKDQSNEAECKAAGDYGESLFRDELRRLKGKEINGFVSTSNLKYQGREFEIDFIVLVPKVGLVIAETKFHKGTIVLSDEDDWLQIKDGVEKTCRNYSKQVYRQKSLLKNMLSEYHLADMPVYPVLVYTHSECRLTIPYRSQQPYAKVLIKEDFQVWLSTLPRSEAVDVGRQTYDLLTELCGRYRFDRETGFG